MKTQVMIFGQNKKQLLSNDVSFKLQNKSLKVVDSSRPLNHSPVILTKIALPYFALVFVAISQIWHIKFTQTRTD